MALSGAKVGATIGEIFGPAGEVIGAGIGGLAGLGATAYAQSQRNRERGTAQERQPLIRPNPIGGRTINVPDVSGLRQRNVPGRETRVPGRETRVQNPDTLSAEEHEARVEASFRNARARSEQNRMPRIPLRTVAKAGAVLGAAATTAAVGAASNVPPRASGPTPQVPNDPNIPPLTPSNPTTTPEDSKQPEIPADVIQEHFDTISARAQKLKPERTGNYSLPVYGRHDYIEWTKYTEGNAIAAQY